VTGEDPGATVVTVSSRRRLYRSRSHRLIGGVCGGLGDFFGIKPTLVRIGFALFGLFGVGEVVYLVLWLLVPKEPR
jgi:phage shock protein C